MSQATKSDLLLAILALDAYNRAETPGMPIDATQVGAATVGLDSSYLPLSSTVGFYAVKYTVAGSGTDLDGKTVISYRGTEFNGVLGPSLADVIEGWTLSAGFGDASQAQFAKQFYSDATNAALYTTAPSNVILTGHSLGGGLAGFVSSLTGARAAIFNNIAFGSGAVADILTHDLLQGLSDVSSLLTGGSSSGYYYWPHSSPQIRQFVTFGEVAAALRLGSPLLSTGVFMAGLGGVGAPLVGALGAAAAAGALAAAGAALDQTTTSQTISSYAGFPTNPTALHSQSLLVTLLYADVNQLTDWQAIGPQLFDAEFNATIAKALGYQDGDPGWYGPEAKMLATIAYSAIDPSSPAAGKPFGDAAIRALFDDADQLGKVYAAGVNPQLVSNFFSALDNGSIKAALAEIAVQYAGDLAKRASTDNDAKKGVFELLDSDARLKADFDSDKWKSTFNLGDQTGGEEKIVGVQSLVKALAGDVLWENGLFNPTMNAAMKAALAKYKTDVSDFQDITRFESAAKSTAVTLDASDAVKAKSGKDGGAILIGGDGKDTITGGKGSDLLVGGKEADVFNWSPGSDLIFGGDGEDTYDAGDGKLPQGVSDRGSVIFFGGAGDKDDADYRNLSVGVEFSAGATLDGAADQKGITVKIGTDGATDLLFGVEQVNGTDYGDKATLIGSVDAFLKWLSDGASAGLKTVLDFGGQQNSPPPSSGPNQQSPVAPTHGDMIAFLNVDPLPTGSTGEGAAKGLVFNYRDQDAQFVADMQGAVPTRLGYDGKVPTNSFEVMKFIATSIVEFLSPTNLSNYAADKRLNLKNVESATGTDQSDLIIGADTVYTWKTPDPTPENPNPQQERVVDKEFRGYELKGEGGNDTIIVYDGDKDQINWRLIDGGDGNDVIVARDAGKQYFIDPATGQLTRSEIKGGAGDDVIFSIGSGEGGDVIGGEGSDLLMNTAYKGRIWGNSQGVEDHTRDVFLWSAGSFIMDAGEEDSLQFFGLPLTGGWGVALSGEQWAYDWWLPFIRYGLSDSKQLIVQSSLANIVGHRLRASSSDDILKSSMIVEKFDQGNGGNWAHLAAGDLGMTFRILNFDIKNAMSAFETVWGMLINRLDALKQFGKELHWLSADDPLILDLDGDGIETSSKDQGGVHFDFNGDDFAEASGWVGADDGFLVLDRDGDGKIGDISELFGAPGGSGFAELRLLDGDSDGVIDAGDVAFDQLQVWRDLNQDGVSQSGELFSLADLGITSLDAIGAAFGVTTPSGALLREKAGFTRADGTRGDLYEAIFETNPLDTLYTGDRGVASYAARGGSDIAMLSSAPRLRLERRL